MDLPRLDLNWAYIIPILLLLVLIHEWGHFITARKVGIKVEEFGFGLPPRLFGFVRNGVLYSINALPFGGFVRMLGEDGASEDPASFNQKKPWQRALVTGAGALMNFLFAVVLLAVIAMGYGRPTPTGMAEINGVVAGSPAAVAGWRAGDVVVSVAGQPITEYRELTPLIRQHAGQTIEVVLRRGGEMVTTTVTPRANPPAGEGATGVVIAPQVEYVPLPIWEAIPAGFTAAVRFSWTMLEGLGSLLLSLFGRGDTVGPVTGPIGMGQLVGEAVEKSSLPVWVTLANLTALLSLNLFLINLLPLPALDGGRLLFIGIELLRGRRVNPNREGMVHFVGLVLLLTLIMVISVFDITRIMSGRPLLP
jgi:regulator of sigma E protease